MRRAIVKCLFCTTVLLASTSPHAQTPAPPSTSELLAKFSSAPNSLARYQYFVSVLPMLQCDNKLLAQQLLSTADSELGLYNEAVMAFPFDNRIAPPRSMPLPGPDDWRSVDATDAVVEMAEKNEKARLLMTQPGVGSITALAFVLTMGDVSRFKRGKQVASYLGLIPREYSSGGHQRLGSISKQGSCFMRMLLVEAAQVAVRCDAGFRKEYLHRCHTKAKGVAKVAAARKLAIRLYWMLRTMTKYPEIVRVESSSRVPLVVSQAG